jgi:PD-(D/E)XK nuclease superfamily
MNKTKAEIEQLHDAQLLTYQKLSGHRLGFLVNWNGWRGQSGAGRCGRSCSDSRYRRAPSSSPVMRGSSFA